VSWGSNGPGAARTDRGDPEADPRPERGGAFDYRGRVAVAYRPEVDGEPDPGEVVWAWVPYAEDPGQGKDRPLVVVGHALDSPGDLAVLLLSSRDRDGEPGWVGIGRGGWDRDGRPSWARVDRPLAVAPDAVRREGAVLAPAAFTALVTAVAAATDR
jgi:hypothetical protein